MYSSLSIRFCMNFFAGRSASSLSISSCSFSFAALLSRETNRRLKKLSIRCNLPVFSSAEGCTVSEVGRLSLSRTDSSSAFRSRRRELDFVLAELSLPSFGSAAEFVGGTNARLSNNNAAAREKIQNLSFSFMKPSPQKLTLLFVLTIQGGKDLTNQSNELTASAHNIHPLILYEAFYSSPFSSVAKCILVI